MNQDSFSPQFKENSYPACSSIQSSPQAHNYLGKVFMGEGNIPRAITEFEEALRRVTSSQYLDGPQGRGYSCCDVETADNHHGGRDK